MAVVAQYDCFLADEAATLNLGQALAAHLAAPLVVWLEGDLGAGKTTLVRGLLRGLGHHGAVKSPTYALVESYRPPSSNMEINHFDLYRFTHPDEWVDAGLDELFHPEAVCLIEWPQQGGSHVPAADLRLALSHAEPGRQLTLSAHRAHAAACLHPLDLSIWQN